MIIPNSNPFVAQSQNLVSSDFGAKLDGKFFKMITESQYENKIGSPVRELSCNALDSHNSVGRGDVPFEIHLPSIYEPWFSVRDFGSGMSDEFVKSTYKMFGGSTKDNSNDNIGGFGLGSKTPLAYTDSFSVCSIYNGVKSHYSVIYGDSGIPALTPFGSEPTDEINGVEIKFSVKSDHYRSFSNEVIKQLMFFKVKPVLLNNTFNVAFSDISYKNEFGNFKITDSVSGMWIVQGEVGYRLDKDQFAEKIKDKDKLEFFNLYSNGLMFFDIGDIEVTISRESVSYSQHTVDNLEKFVAIHAPIIFGNIKTQIESMSCDWERLCFLNEDYTNRRFAALAGLKFGEKGNIGDMKLAIHGSGSTSYIITMTKDWRDGINKTFNISTFDKSKLSRTYFNSAELIITPTNKIKVFVRDVAKSSIGKLKNYVMCNQHQDVYLIEHPEGATAVDKAFVSKIKKFFGGVDVELVSSFPELTKSSAISKKGPVVVYKNGATIHNKFNIESFYHWERIYDEEEIEGGYYMIYTNFPRMDASFDDLDMIRQVMSAGLFDKPIYIIKDTKQALLVNNPNFSCAIEKAKNVIDENEKKILTSEHEINRYKLASKVNAKVRHHIGASGSSIMICSDDISRLSKMSYPMRMKRMDSISKKYIDRVAAKIEAQPNKILRKLFLERIQASHHEGNDEIFDAVDQMKDSFYAKYPMLAEVNTNSYTYYPEKETRRSKNMVDYMLAVDKLNG